MGSHDLAAIGVFYSASTILLLALHGVVYFGEAFGLRQLIGVSFAVAAVVIIEVKGLGAPRATTLKDPILFRSHRLEP